jgi:hypothetical protein
MPPVSSPAGGLVSSPEQLLRELRDLQKSVSEQASNYTKLIFGLGYAGFFTAWSGSKNYLRPGELLASALLVCASLVVFLVYEIFQARFLSYVGIEFARAVGNAGAEVKALEEYKRRVVKAQEPFFRWWSPIFHFCAATGLFGASILLFAFVHALWRMR